MLEVLTKIEKVCWKYRVVVEWACRKVMRELGEMARVAQKGQKGRRASLIGYKFEFDLSQGCAKVS